MAEGEQVVPLGGEGAVVGAASHSSPVVEGARRDGGFERAVASDFDHGGSAIHPLCIAPLVMGETTPFVDLASCGQTPEDAAANGVVRSGQTLSHRYRDLAPPGRKPFIEYEVLARSAQDFVVRYLWNGGGSGYFSGLMVVTKEGDRLRLKDHITGGDRCNGGLQSGKFHGGVVEYSNSITPVDMLGMAPRRDAELGTAEPDLESSAASCFAVVQRRYHPNSGKSELVAVHTNPQAADATSSFSARFKHQGCFNKVYNRHLDQRLSPDRFQQFLTVFRRACL